MQIWYLLIVGLLLERWQWWFLVPLAVMALGLWLARLDYQRKIADLEESTRQHAKRLRQLGQSGLADEIEKAIP